MSFDDWRTASAWGAQKGLTSVDVEEVIAGHAGLARHAGRDHDQAATVQSFRQLLSASEAAHLRIPGAFSSQCEPKRYVLSLRIRQRVDQSSIALNLTLGLLSR